MGQVLRSPIPNTVSTEQPSNHKPIDPLSNRSIAALIRRTGGCIAKLNKHLPTMQPTSRHPSITFGSYRRRRTKSVTSATFDMWLGCSTQQEIADTTSEPVGTIKRLTGDGDDSLVQFGKLAKTNQTAAEHATGCLCSELWPKR